MKFLIVIRRTGETFAFDNKEDRAGMIADMIREDPNVEYAISTDYDEVL